MSDFELTDDGIQALVSSAIVGVLLIVIKTIPTYGVLLAFLSGLALIIIGMFNLWGVWKDNSESPIIGILFVSFGIVFEFGTVTDIATVLPYCLVIDAVIFVVSALVTFGNRLLDMFR